MSNSKNELHVAADTVKLCGRNYLEGGFAAFSNTFAGIAFSFQGTELSVDFASTNYKQNEETYAAVFIDDEKPVVLKVDKQGYQKITGHLKNGVKHKAKIVKRSESNTGALIIRKVKTSEDGIFYQVEKSECKRRILFIGDSITCGFGNLYAGGETENWAQYEDGTNTYATMLAHYFQAELEIVCISGIGIGNSRNSPYPIQPFYNKQDNRSNNPHNPRSFIPDVVVIGLGTNDDMQKATPDEIRQGLRSLIADIRSDYPDSKIIWTYGVMSRDNMDTIRSEIDHIIYEGDKQLVFIPLDQLRDDEKPHGLYDHPGIKTHRRMADDLKPVIKSFTGWK